jgi:DNA-binding response OmpR family regulator
MNQIRSILYVEDDQNDAILVTRALRQLHAEVKVNSVEDVETAIAYLQGEGIYADRETYPTPGMILLDIKIPGQSGLDLLRWLRDQKAFCTLPVVMFTSSMVESDIKNAYQLGANSYIVKPVSFEELMQKICGIVQVWLKINLAPEVS